MTDDEKAKHDSDYQALLALFIALLRNINTDAEEEALYELAELRAKLAIQHAVKGFGIDMETALQLLKAKDDNTLTQLDKDKRDRLLAAVRNLIEFAVCEEYQLWLKAKNKVSSGDVDFNSEEYQELLDECSLYNDQYAAVEDSDIEYSMNIASWWVLLPINEYLTYMTQNDDRVRPWHMALQGFTAKRDDFPAWMIPPIEWACRCYLLAENGDIFGNADLKNVKAVSKVPQKPAQLDGVFEESVAKCGRIFSPKHPYFSVKESDRGMLNGFVERLKEKWYA